MRTEKDILETIHDQILDGAIRAEIDYEFWSGMEVNPIAGLDDESRKNVYNQKKKNELNKTQRRKILEIIERKLRAIK